MQDNGMTCFKCGEKTLEWVIFQENGQRIIGEIEINTPSSLVHGALVLHFFSEIPLFDHDKAKHCIKSALRANFVNE